MANLQFIKSASGSGVGSVSVTDCFSDDYDIYFVISDVQNVSSTFQNVSFRYINASGIVTTSTYDSAHADLDTSTAFGDAGYVNDTDHEAWQISDDTRDGTVGTAYIYNPYDSSKYTFHSRQNQGSTSGEYRGRKGIGGEKTQQRITGMNFSSRVSGQTADFLIKVYGVK